MEISMKPCLIGEFDYNAKDLLNCALLMSLTLFFYLFHYRREKMKSDRYCK